MNTYRTVFVNNSILSVTLVTDSKHHFEGDIYYSTYKDHLVYAIIKTSSESDARKKSEDLIQQFLKK